MKILLYGLNYAPEMTGIGKYTGQLGAWLNDRGHEVKAVSAPPYYPEWRLSKGFRNRFSKEMIGGVEVCRCPVYIPQKPSTILRLLHLFSFVFSSTATLVFLLSWRPSIVINVVPAMFSSFPALLYCKITGAKLVIHIQDFESDAMSSLGMNKMKLLPKIWSKLERFVLSNADIVSTISKAMIDNAISKGVHKSNTLYFPNWSEIERFVNVPRVAEFKESLDLPNDKKIILYSGNIGQKQGLDLVIEVAEIAEKDNLDILFLICGDGAAKAQLIELVNSLKLNNVRFLSLQPYEYLPQLLAMADAHLVIQNPDVANAVLPSKLTNILAVGGNAVITTRYDTEMGKLIEDFPGAAIAVEPENAEELLAGIKLAYANEKINKVALSYANKFLAKESILEEFEKQIESLIVKERNK